MKFESQGQKVYGHAMKNGPFSTMTHSTDRKVKMTLVGNRHRD